MKILHVNKYLYRRGGAEAYMDDLAALQRGAGHDVEFFGMAHPQNEPRTYERHFPSYLELEPPPASLPGKLRGVGRMIWSTSARRGIEEVVVDFAPDVVHLHNIYHHLSPSILGPVEGRGIPAVMTLHDYKLACPTYRFLDHGRICEACLGGHFQQAVLRRCKDGSLTASSAMAFELFLHTATHAYEGIRLFVCPSRFLAEKMAAAGVYPERLRVLRHFVETDGVPVKERAGGPVLFAGRLSHEKGVDTLIEAVGRLPGAELHVAGDGPDLPRLESLAGRVADGRVRFHGRVPKERLRVLFRESSVVAVPSRWYENQPLIVLEAFASGLPVVGTRLGGIPELVSPGVDGDLAPPDDADALAASLEPLLADPERALAMGRAGRGKAEQEFSPANHLAGLQRLYDEASAAAPVSR